MRLAVFTKNRSNPAYGAARLGADRAAAAVGAEVRHYVPDTPDDPVQQSALIERALQDPPDAFVISPVHATRVNPALEKIARAGIPMVGFVNPIPVGPSVSYIGADDVRLADALAEYLFTHIAGDGSVLVVTGPADSVTSRDRLSGFMQATARHGGITIAGTLAGDYDRAVARARTAAWLLSHSPPKACLVANDIMAVGVLEALDDAGARADVVGVNAIPEAIRAIADGRMLATANFNAMQMANLATECAIRHLQGRPVPQSLELPVEIVDGSNWSDLDRPYEDRPVLPLEHFWRHA
ncbi:sugar ABC transporter substrate-binding protein [Ramlibacter sp. AN1015]|uniref:sugar ABC transporter substrate-binding protein n=1 Tax=Ramlibacter sp. AN1015 TaxID=3133428 RepID=UPI0030C0A777